MRAIPARQRFVLLAGMSLLLCVALSSWPGREADAEPIAGGPQIVFEAGVLDFNIHEPTALAFGPDGRLYVAGETSIWALTLDPITNDVLDKQQIATGTALVLGLAFDPATPSPVKLYASRQDTSATGSYTGVISTYTAPDWHRDDVITGLPSSIPHNNHMTNGITFGPDGRLYIAQGSNADSGIADPPGNQFFWPETPLSAAILVADIHDPDFDGTLVYNPSSPPTTDLVNLVGGDVQVYAPGTRNPYDLVWHSNGHLYATDNGAMGKGTSLTCSTEGGVTSTWDELNLIEEGNYYGAPNRNRGRFDARQCTYRSPTEGNGADFTAPIATLPSHCSCDGLTEYTSGAFGGALQGNLLYASWGRSYIGRAVLSANGRSVTIAPSLEADLASPLDVVIDASGTIYAAEYGGNRIAYLSPDSDADGCSDSRELGADAAHGGERDPNNPYDFYDITGDGRVTSADIHAVVLAFGPADGPSYRTEKDRSPPPPNASPWELGPPDGVISVLADIAGVVSQYGHSCVPDGS